jgi:DNA-binding CsgD family transcriptional regulator
VVLRQRGSVPASRTAPEASLTFDPGVAMADDAVAGLELAEVAGSSEPVAVRAEALLETLRRFVPFDGAWLALAAPEVPSYSAGASTDLADSTLAFLAGPQPARDIELAGAHRAAPPVSPSDLPFPAVQLPTWAECLLPAGYHEGLGVALFAPGGRHVGFLALLSGDREPPSQQTRHTLGCLVPVLAHGIDPLRSLAAAARLVHGATAGVVLHEAGGTEVLPGLHAHALLTAGSPAVAVAREALAAGQSYTTFLWPRGGRHAPRGHARLTVLAAAEDAPSFLVGTVLVSQPGDLRGLTPRELEVLGLLIEGSSNAAISRALLIAPRTVAAHLEHIMAKLSARSRTLAAVRAVREGLYVPRQEGTPPAS